VVPPDAVLEIVQTRLTLAQSAAVNRVWRAFLLEDLL
jgi:hypothetical protein